MTESLKVVDTVNPYIKHIHTYKGKLIGYFIQDVDGYFYFEFESKEVYWSSNILREIADKLDEINKEWDNRVKQIL